MFGFSIWILVLIACAYVVIVSIREGFKQLTNEALPRVEIYEYQRFAVAREHFNTSYASYVWEKVRVDEGAFLQYGVEAIESDLEGAASYTTAVVLMDNGTIETPSVNLVRFLNPNNH